MKTKLTAKEWINIVLVSNFKKLEQLQTLSIRQLKALAQKINNELGQVIVKARFGKVMSRMNKAELVAAIWAVRVCQMQTRMYDHDLVQVSSRIFEYSYAEGAPGYRHWLTYFGFKSDGNGTAQQNAERFRQHLLSKGFCHLAAIRSSHIINKKTGELEPNSKFRLSKFGFEWEVKVWGIKNECFSALVGKDKGAREKEMRTPIIPITQLSIEEQQSRLQAEYDRHISYPNILCKTLSLINALGFEVENNKVLVKF